MEKKEKKYNKLIAFFLVTLIVFNTIFTPQVNAAGILNQAASSVIRNPLAWLLIDITDDVNRILAAVFAVDDKWESFRSNSQDAWNHIKSSNGVLEGILTLGEDAQETWFDLMLSPDDIFGGNVQITNANIFSEKFSENGGGPDSADLNTFNHLIKQVKQGVGGLYYTMRNLAAVILLILLIYCGIRMVLSSNMAGERAKWKMYLIEWLKALALVMFIHYIMIAVFYIAEVITSGLSDTLADGHTLVTQIRKGIMDTFALDSLRTLGICNYVHICIIFKHSIFSCIFQKVCIFNGANNTCTNYVSFICIW